MSGELKPRRCAPATPKDHTREAAQEAGELGVLLPAAQVHAKDEHAEVARDQCRKDREGPPKPAMLSRLESCGTSCGRPRSAHDQHGYTL